MSKRSVRERLASTGLLAALAALALASLTPPAGSSSQGPIDHPVSKEPRVAVAKCLTPAGLVYSTGNFVSFAKADKGDTLYSRDLLIAVPGLKAQIEPDSKAVGLTLWGNLPGLSDAPVLESAVVLHDSKAYDLDVSLVRGRIVLTNKKEKGAAKVWLRAENGVELDLLEPGTRVSLEIYGRWPAGVPFSLKNKPTDGPVRLWEVNCLKGKLQIKAGRTQWSMEAPPGASYFHGDSVDGPAGSPEKQPLPAWDDPKAEVPAVAKTIKEVLAKYQGTIKTKDAEDTAEELFRLSLKDTDKERARITRQMVIFTQAALDEVAKVAEYLETSKVADARDTAVVALRHWIGAREGRDEKLYDILKDELGYSKAEAVTIMQMLHSPFDRRQPETYETLITYLKHRKQAIRELAAWHLYRLTPVGKTIAFDASAPLADRTKAVDAWKKLIPDGELPKQK